MQSTGCQLTITKEAINQLNLIKENDYTIQDKIVRVTISGKECDGFVYSIGFDEIHPDDIVVKDITFSYEVHMDPFTAHYLKNGKIDFVLDLENNTDGFTVINFDQDLFKGKFFKDETLEPLHLKK